MATGCTSPTSRPILTDSGKGSEKDGASKPQTANTRSGEATRYSETLPKTPLWLVRWDFAEVTYDEKGRFGGEMNLVRGEAYEAGKPRSAFQAKSARAEYGSNRLVIRGEVVIEVAQPKTTLRCREIVWNPDDQRYEAKGGVRVETEQYTLGPFAAVYASADLQRVGTPKHFEGKL